MRILFVVWDLKTNLKVNDICKVKYIDTRVVANKTMLNSVFEARVTDYTATSVSDGKIKGLKRPQNISLTVRHVYSYSVNACLIIWYHIVKNCVYAVDCYTR